MAKILAITITVLYLIILINLIAVNSLSACVPFIVLFMLAVCVGRWAIYKGRNGYTWFLFAFLLNPIIIAIILAFKKREMVVG